MGDAQAIALASAESASGLLFRSPHTHFEVVLFAEKDLELGKNDIWWCPSLTLRVSIAREQP